METIYAFTARTITGERFQLEAVRGQVVLIVNTASRCGFTGQYAGLEAVYRRYRERGFTVLGFPCDKFLHQEPGNEADIVRFCSTTYQVTFPLFAKIAVNGPGTHPLYAFLKRQKPGLLGIEAIKWNFTKFLVDRAGQVRGRYAPMVRPEALSKAIEPLL